MAFVKNIAIWFESLNENPKRFRIVFFILLVATMSPLFVSYYFPSLDSPAHLYNAKLILEILQGDNYIVQHFYQYNPLLVPNWIGHALLALFYFICGEWWLAEKLMLVLYLVSLPLAVDYFIRTIGGNRWLSFWSFPFVFSFVFSIGFYNFSLSIIFALLFLARSWQFFESHYSVKENLILFSLLLTVYLSHGFTFLLTLFIWGASALPHLIHEWKKSESIKSQIYRFIKAVVLILPLVVLYRLNTAYHSGSPTFLEREDLIKDIFRWRSLIVYHEGKEERWTVIMSLLTIALSILVFVRTKIRFTLPQQRVILTLITLFMLYFLLPDNTGSAGFISVRIQGWLALMTIVFISVSTIPNRLSLATTILMLVAHFALVHFHAKVLRKDGMLLDQCALAQQYIPEHSILHFEDLSGDWRFQHFSNFIALQSKDVACTENYEAAVDYFPMCFKSMSNEVVGSLNCTEQKLIMKPVVKDSIYQNTLKERLAKGNRIVFENESIVLLQSTK